MEKGPANCYDKSMIEFSMILEALSDCFLDHAQGCLRCMSTPSCFSAMLERDTTSVASCLLPKTRSYCDTSLIILKISGNEP